MAIGFKISDFNQAIEVQGKSKVKQPDGTYTVSVVPKFSTSFANVVAINSSQFFSEGVSEKDSYYWVSIAYASGRQIAMSDTVLWNGKTLKPVGDSIIEASGKKRFIKQKVKHTSDV